MNASVPTGGRPPGSVSPAGLLVDARGRVAEWSPEAERLLGHPPERVLGRPVVDLLAPAPETGMPAGDVLLRHLDGRTVPCCLRVRPAQDDRAGRRWAVQLTPAEPNPVEKMDHALLRALFSQSPIGLFVVDPQLRLVRINSAASGLQGVPVQEALGQRLTEAWPEFTAAEQAERIMARVLESGEPLIDVEKRGRPRGDPEREHVYSASAFRLEDADGRILGVAEAGVDVTDRHRVQERLALVADAGASVGTTLDVLRTAQELAGVVVPRLADSVAVDVLDPVLGGDELPSDPAAGVVLRRAASRSRRTDLGPGVYGVGDVSDLPPAAPALQALVDHLPRLVRSVGEESAWVHSDLAPGRRTPEEKVHSLMLVPLVARDSVLGLVTFHRWTGPDPFDEADLAVAVDLAGRAALALDNARRYVRERNAVLALQRGMLPQRLPAPSAVEAAHHLVHSGAGGDWADVIPLPGARVALAVGSVPGRGLHTAAAMGRLRAAVHTLASLDMAPDEVLARLDELVRHLAREEAGPPPDRQRGATCLYVVYDPVSLCCTMAAAGRPGPAVVRPDGTVDFPDLSPAEPLGCPGPPFGVTPLELPVGSLLVLHTAGLLQTGQGEEGRARLARLLAPLSGSPQEMCLALTDGLLPQDPCDDAAVLVARTRALDADSVATWDLPADPAAVATARALAIRQLAAWALDEEVFTTELIVSELVTNAIRHAEPPVRLRLIRDQALTCEVFDGSSAAPQLRHARTTDEGGRGLLLVGQLAQRWGTRRTERGKTVWAEQSISATAEPVAW